MTELLESKELQSWRDEGLRYVIMKIGSGPAGEDKMTLIPFRTIPGAEFYLLHLWQQLEVGKNRGNHLCHRSLFCASNR